LKALPLRSGEIGHAGENADIGRVERGMAFAEIENWALELVAIKPTVEARLFGYLHGYHVSTSGRLEPVTILLSSRRTRLRAD